MGTRHGSSGKYPAAVTGVACAAESKADLRFAVPALPAGHVDRNRLTHSLDSAAGLPLTLVCAPAGTGKTTLASAWSRADGAYAHAAWVTFDDGPLEAAAFWSAVFTAARRHVDLAPLRVVAAVERPGRRAATSLAAAVAAREDRLTLVLDGFEHVADSVAADLDFLLRHSGDRLRLVLLSRVEPALPLHRYRLDGSVHEVRTADLAFTDAEARRLLALAGVELSAASCGRLNSHLGGWAAGLRFAVRSLAGRTDPDGAVPGAGGSGGTVEAAQGGETGEIGEYLRAEVLGPQTTWAREVLVDTCVVDVLEPGLVEALAGPAAARSLRALSRSNTFVEPLPDEPRNYRMQPMFREMLLGELAESPRRRTRLHRRAARWYAGQGRLGEAVHHAADARAWRAAAGYVVDDLAVAQLLTGGFDLAEPLRAMPAEAPGPAAAVVRGALALAAGEPDRCALQVALARERCREAGTARERNVLVAADVLDTVRACFVQDPCAALVCVRAAEHRLAACGPGRLGRHPELGALVKACQGVALLRCGDLREAHEAMLVGAGAVHARGCEPLAVGCLGYLALLAALQGHLRRARDWANKAVAGADSSRLPAAERSVAARVALAWVSIEQHELAEARSHVRAAMLSELSHTLHADPVPRTLLTIVQSRLSRAHDDLRGALSVLEGARRDDLTAPDWVTDQLCLEQAEVRLALGEPDRAVAGLDALARTPGLRGALVRAQAQMEQTPGLSLDGQLSGLLVPAQPLQALVAGWLLEAASRLRDGEVDRARVALERSLRLAAPERLRRPFHEAPAEVADLLADELRRAGHARWLDSARPAAPAHVGEPLTARELEVVGYLADLLSTDEIAATMYVSVNTVRTHVRSILRKMGVSRRNEAVRRARELNLIGSNPAGSSDR